MRDERSLGRNRPPDQQRPDQDSLHLLTPREREVLQLMAKGLTNAEIAETLYISKHTVKNHVSNIYRKLKVDDRTQIALLAIRQGLVSLD